jgi:metal-sulfur cluster biosynthetic enzyme
VVRWVCGGKGTAVEVSGRRERCGCIDASQSQESVGAALVDVEGIEEVRLEINALSSIGVDVVSAEGERRIVKKGLRGASQKMQRARGFVDGK